MIGFAGCPSSIRAISRPDEFSISTSRKIASGRNPRIFSSASSAEEASSTILKSVCLRRRAQTPSRAPVRHRSVSDEWPSGHPRVLSSAPTPASGCCVVHVLNDLNLESEIYGNPMDYFPLHHFLILGVCFRVSDLFTAPGNRLNANCSVSSDTLCRVQLPHRTDTDPPSLANARLFSDRCSSNVRRSAFSPRSASRSDIQTSDANESARIFRITRPRCT